ncbi:alkane 1-monooxygenase [Streptomyces sp. NPDC054838]
MSVFWWWGVVAVVLVVPLLDRCLGSDTESPQEGADRQLDGDRYYRWCVYLYIPLQYGSLFWACDQWSNENLGWVNGTGLALATGIVAGVAITAAHELGHRKDRLERLLAAVGLAQSWYGHYSVSHNLGHHRHVATPSDPSSARMGESLWAFLARAVSGTILSAWGLECRRLRRRGRPVWAPGNRLLVSWTGSAALFAVLVWVFGVNVLPYLILQALVGVSVLEGGNYVQHYGLLRAERSPGRYEGVSHRHSWNSSRLASSVFLYQLQRHSDHHVRPTARYQGLRHVEQSPQLPAGYVSMIVLAFCPPLWRHVMDPRVLAEAGGDLSRVNRA